MNTPAFSKEEMIARVAIDVRLYFDVTTSSENSEDIQRTAREELERVADGQQIRIMQLRYPEIYPCDVWPVIKSADFQICQICSPADANAETRFSL